MDEGNKLKKKFILYFFIIVYYLLFIHLFFEIIRIIGTSHRSVAAT